VTSRTAIALPYTLTNAFWATRQDGPFHRHQTAENPEENEQISTSGQIWGKPRGQYAGDIASVKAWNGSIPPNVVGIEFFTDVQPEPERPPQWPEWLEGRPGVITLEKNQLVAIPVIVTRRQD
jgi:hypothetical protein